jgi:crotonobetainyl-CoA:carnitine CoA-transferase CaiB-like acyl-CoA transferase
VKFRDRITTAHDDDLGPLTMQNLTVRLTDRSWRDSVPRATPGQDNNELYRELLDIDGQELERLRKEGVL